ncbi:hypothetical protein EVAR_22430_1 [Eumeta japonica]|uniref:Uncharacterized protein n=1 Tax=Eumeta variegata TaxID=151549 RepID=A0A4C1ZWP4_EUMVA|nr:hypothetical protein EVAR_22430_1 [Eumeta japonica]
MRTHNGMLSYVCAVCRLVCYRPSKRGTEDGVRMMEGGRATPGIGESTLQGRWSQVRPGLPFPEGERPAPGLAANQLVDTVSCEAWRPAAPRTLDRQGREGRGAAICTKSE